MLSTNTFKNELIMFYKKNTAENVYYSSLVHAQTREMCTKYETCVILHRFHSLYILRTSTHLML